MSLIAKIVLPVAIAAAAIWGYLQYTQPAADSYGVVPAQQQPTPLGTAEGGAAAAPAAQAEAEITARDTSNTSLDADLKAIDAQLQAAAESQASVDAGLNDKAGNTTY